MTPSIEMNNPALQRGRGCLGTIAYIQLAEQAVDVGLYRRFRDVQIACDLLIAASCNDPFQNFEFARGECRAAHALGEFLRDKSGYL